MKPEGSTVTKWQDGKIIQVIQFAEFLSFDKKPQRGKAYSKEISKDVYIRKPGILKRKMETALEEGMKLITHDSKI